MKKVLLLVMCVFGFQSASYGFLGTALNAESEKAFLKSLEMHSSMTGEQAKKLLLKASRLQSQLHGWSAAGAAITAPFCLLFAYIAALNFKNISKKGVGSGIDLLISLSIAGLCGAAGLAFGKSLATSIRAKKRAVRYNKMAQKSEQLKAYQGFMSGFNEKNKDSLAWNTIVQSRKKAIKRGLSAQLIGVSAGAAALIASGLLLLSCVGEKYDDEVYAEVDPVRESRQVASLIAAIAGSLGFTLFSAYALKGIVRKQAMKKFMDQIEHKSPGARAIAQDPEAATLAKIAEWEQEEAAAHARPVA
jgi:hypothetical protein